MRMFGGNGVGKSVDPEQKENTSPRNAGIRLPMQRQSTSGTRISSFELTTFSAKHAGDQEERILRTNGERLENELLELQLHKYVSSFMTEHSIPDRSAVQFQEALRLLTNILHRIFHQGLTGWRLKLPLSYYIMPHRVQAYRPCIYWRHKGQIQFLPSVSVFPAENIYTIFELKKSCTAALHSNQLSR